MENQMPVVTASTASSKNKRFALTTHFRPNTVRHRGLFMLRNLPRLLLYAVPPSHPLSCARLLRGGLGVPGNRSPRSGAGATARGCSHQLTGRTGGAAATA